MSSHRAAYLRRAVPRLSYIYGWRDRIITAAQFNVGIHDEVASVVNGGRLPDPPPAAGCARCDRPREEHGGTRNYGACPSETGLYAGRFKLRESDKRRGALPWVPTRVVRRG